MDCRHGVTVGDWYGRYPDIGATSAMAGTTAAGSEGSGRLGGVEAGDDAWATARAGTSISSHAAAIGRAKGMTIS